MPRRVQIRSSNLEIRNKSEIPMTQCTRPGTAASPFWISVIGACRLLRISIFRRFRALSRGGFRVSGAAGFGFGASCIGFRFLPLLLVFPLDDIALLRYTISISVSGDACLWVAFAPAARNQETRGRVCSVPALPGSNSPSAGFLRRVRVSDSLVSSCSSSKGERR